MTQIAMADQTAHLHQPKTFNGKYNWTHAPNVLAIQ